MVRTINEVFQDAFAAYEYQDKYLGGKSEVDILKEWADSIIDQCVATFKYNDGTILCNGISTESISSVKNSII